MPGLSTSLLGKQQKTFRLLTEETAVKWRAPVGDIDTSTQNFSAGSLVELTSAGIVTNIGIAGTAIATESIVGVSMDNFVPTLNECAGSGEATVIVNPGHIAQTAKYDTGDTFADGDKLYPSASVTGNFSSTATGLGLAYLVKQRGAWLEYLWTGRQAAS